MKKYLLLVICFFCSVWVNAQVAQLPLMPYPQMVEQHAGSLAVGNSLGFFSDAKNNVVLKKQMQLLAQRIQQQTGQAIRLKTTSAAKAQLLIRVGDSKLISNTLSEWDESYQLHISAEKIELTAAQWLGAQRGLETLLQLVGTEKNIHLPLVNITDYPRFKWRGLLLDTSRHFFSVTTIKRQIDAMAAAKYNIFHWHLTDDQGWRFESKKYPKLHQLASDGDYYTRKQMRDVVAYARARGIQVLPEIDMPGHASAIAVAYPELMSAPGPYAMEYRWGVHKPTLNPANEQVYKFAEAIVTEVAEIFPFEYLHIGGDEVDPEQWNNNPAIQLFMQEHKLSGHQALQAFFNQRLQIILQKHQRKMIGWDEIQHPDLPKNIVIHSWRGPDGVSDAVNHGFQSILSTGYYLDQPQSSAYHYRNDPIPPTPVVSDSIVDKKQLTAWRFSMPRKRGKPVTGVFTLRKASADENNKMTAASGFIDFTGKSRRELTLINYTQDSAQFSLDTWMGPVEFQVNFVDDQLQGRAIVGNSPYVVSGEKITTAVPIAEVVPSLNTKQTALILGGEAALWAEMVDEQNIDLRLWPRALVVAERLWSARELQNENNMYARLTQVASWAEKTVGLQHRQQNIMALKKLAGEHEVSPLVTFAQALEPAQYYHRHHEKSAHASYSKADRLDLLADALPAESDLVRELNQQLDAWLQNPQKNAQYFLIRTTFERWIKNKSAMSVLLKRNPQWQELTNKMSDIASKSIALMDLRLKTSVLMQNEKNKAKNLVYQAQMLSQEMVIATAFSLDKIVNSFSAP